MRISKKYLLLLFSMLYISIKAQTLNQFLNLAMKHSLELKMAYADFEISLLNIDKVSVLEDPNIKFGYFINPIETRLGSQRAKFSLNQKIPWFGRVSKEKALLTYKAESMFERFENKKLELVLDIKKSFYNLLEAKENIDLKTEYLSILKSNKIWIENQYKHGKVNQVELLKLDIRIDQVKAQLDVLKLALLNQKVIFNTKLHRSTTTKIVLTDSLEFIPIENNVDQSVKHPKLKTIEKKIAASKSQINLVKALNKPKLALGLDYMFIEEIPEATVVNNGKDAIMPSFQISLPLHSNKNKAKIKSAILQLEKERYMKDHIAQELESEIELNIYKLKSIRVELLNNNSTQKQLAQILQLQHTQYKSNTEELDDILNTQKDIIILKTKHIALSKQANILQAELSYLQNTNGL